MGRAGAARAASIAAGTAAAGRGGEGGPNRRPAAGVRSAVPRVLLLLVPLLLIGCQSGVAPVELWRASAVQARLPTTRQAGPLLDEAAPVAEVAATLAPPAGWSRRPLQEKPFARHLQFRSPDEHAPRRRREVRAPAAALGREPDVARQATLPAAGERRLRPAGDVGDELGRRWLRGTTKGRVNVDGEAGDWEAVGYLVTKGFDGWMVYRSRRTDIDPPADDLAAAERAVEAVVPDL